MQLNSQQKEQIKSIISHPDYDIIDKVLRAYIEPLLDMKDIDMTQDAGSIKGEIQARISLHKKVTNYLIDVEILKQNINRVKPNMK